MIGYISWDGKRSDDYGILIEKYPSYKKPKRKMERYSVPGRNGDIIMMQDAWENVEQEYDIVFGDGTEHSAAEIQHDVSEWLFASSGYCELSDSFDTDHFRKAFVEGPIENYLFSIGRAGRATITFNCKPQLYLNSGKQPTRYTAISFELENPTAYNARPLIYVERVADADLQHDATCSVTINDTILSLDDVPAGGIYIDCEEMSCYDGNGINMNDHLSSFYTLDYAKLTPGENQISFGYDAAAVTITPRWFTI